MNKYMVTLHTFCDACYSQQTCKTHCRRMQEMEKFVKKYDKLARAYDRACAELSIGTSYFANDTKDEVKECLLDEQH